MLKTIKKVVMLSALCGIFTYMVAPVSQAQDLIMTSVMYSTHSAFTRVYFPLLRDKMKEVTNGKVKLVYYEPGTLVPDKENFQAVEDGAVDITSTIPSLTPNQFLAFSIMDQPMLFSSSSMGALVANKLVEESKSVQKEFKNVHPLWAEASVPNHLLSKKPILNLEDMKGKRIGVRTAAVSDAIKLLGGVPVLLPASDMYISIQRGMLDGVLLPIPQYKASKVVEVAKHMTPCALITSGFMIVINQDSFDKLPEEAKDYLDSITGEVGAAFEGAWIDYNGKADLKNMQEKNGLIIHKFPESERALWGEKVASMHDVWKAKMEKKGIDSKEIMAIVTKYVEYYSDPVNLEKIREKGKEILPGLYPPEGK